MRAWTERRLAAVRELLAVYFKRIGGFAIANSRTVHLWHDALDLFSADELAAAIEAKARSLEATTAADRRDRRRFAAHPARFVRVAGYWWTQSPEYRARRQAGRELRAERLRRALSDLRLRSGGPRGGLSGLAAPRAAESPQATLWASLRPAQREAALAAVGPTFRARCRQWGENPEAAHLVPVLIGMATEWAAGQWPAADLFTGESLPGRT